MEQTEITASYRLAFNDQYLLGSDGNIYRLHFSYKGRFYGMKKVKPQYKGKNKACIGWYIQMLLGKKPQFWYLSQLRTQFVKMEKIVVIKTMEINGDFYGK